jgi:uncharacterized protein (DUF697 family)
MAEETVSKHDQAEKSIRYYGKWAAAAGVIPVPVADLAAVAGIQLKMLSDLAKVYEVPFKSDLGKATLGALAGSLLPAKLGYGGVGSLMKSVPFVGTVAGIVVMPAFNYGSTVAIGRVFAKHFASGGSLLDFSAEAVRDQVAADASALADDFKPPASRKQQAATAS